MMLTLLKAASLLTLICLLVLISFAQPDRKQRDPEKEKKIVEELAAIAPKAVETYKAATVAFDKPDYPEAARLYEAVLKQAPDWDVIYRRLGASKFGVGETTEGMALLETAVQKKASPENLISLAEFLMDSDKDKKAARNNLSRAYELAKRARDLNGGKDADYLALLAQLSLMADHDSVFRETTKVLVEKFPDEMVTHYFNGIRAAMDEDWITSENEIKKAQSLGLPAEEAERILSSGIHSQATVWRYLWYTLDVVAAWAIGLGLLFVLGKVMSKRTLHSIENADPNAATTAQESALRRSYRTLINIAGAYYYLSLPIVMLLVMALAGSIFYAFLLLGRIPIKLVLILGIGVLMTIWKMITSFFMKVQSEDPGRSLSQAEAPGLWTLTREVAQAVGTRPIDEIRITPGTDLAVYEKGSNRERAQDRAKRILILGTANLNGFTQRAFRAVLAHEYGHFSHRDTAGGEVALRVDRDMTKFVYAMACGGQAVWYNVAWQFLRLYHFIFRRITHGATRLQEIMADRVAALNYGGQAFEEGLRHVIARSVEFNHLATVEIHAAQRERRALQNIYQLPGIEGTNAEQGVKEEISAALNSPTTEDDTHPGPLDRFRLASRVAFKGGLPARGMVWDLFTDQEALTAEMSELINTRVQSAT